MMKAGTRGRHRRPTLAVTFIAIIGVVAFGPSASHADPDKPVEPDGDADSNIRAPKKSPPPNMRAERRALVTVSHWRREITGCRRVLKEGDDFCEAAGYRAQDSKTDVELVPLSADGEEETGSGRETRSIKFVETLGKVQQEVELEKGRWELRWKSGSTLRERFFVVPRDVFEIALESINGLCVEKAQGCKLDEGKKQRSVEVPKDRGLPR